MTHDLIARMVGRILSEAVCVVFLEAIGGIRSESAFKRFKTELFEMSYENGKEIGSLGGMVLA